MGRQPGRAKAAACPCGSGEPYSRCCAPLHRGQVQAETAEQLMRARYCAFAKHLGGYIERTWDPSTRPEVIDLSDDIEWVGLEIVRCVRGGREDTAGVVEFRAHHRGRHGDGALGEVSSFRRVGGRPEGEWVYVGVAR